ncbi:MAG: dihydrodipicolinate synthase family protein [Planctomycetes bacterium]|nr:dihydrodipicolinate synthase family protein [Planctomycetota bacterium]
MNISLEHKEALSGLIAAPLVGYTKDGSVDTSFIHDYASLLSSNGVNGVFINGTTGEGMSLTFQERKEVAEKWINTSPKDLSVIIHVGCSSIEESKQLAAHAQQCGADAIGIIGPTFYKPAKMSDLVEFVAAIAQKAPDTPCYYYHMPAINGVDFPMIDFLKEAHGAIPTLAGIKYTFENLMDADLCRQYADGQYNILHGQDETLLCGLTLGATGAVGSTYNFMAPLYVQMIDAFTQGKAEQALKLQRTACDILQCMFECSSYFGAAKVMMRWAGIEINGIRLPLSDIQPHEVAKLKEKLNDVGFFSYSNTTKAATGKEEKIVS